ncbi:protein CASP-like isoform X2 [Symsagittifera roscoffensis]|uniref:protein CASP-like isoform X2 n=1 Tax=Symsagittifera roscoffensis TaxID=84072 RepID=UPI00307BB16D
MAASLANITNVWKEFNLVMFQSELDQVATELADRQENSEQSRKKLIEQNKEFKKNSTAETKKQVAPLLKSFQNEIDDLTNRSKAAEAAFLTVYKRIVEAPDPVPSLEFVQSIQTKASKVADLELENGKLRETLSEYNKEFAEVKNQEVTIKNLREKVKELEDSVESRVSSRLVEKERELAKSYEEKNQLIASSQVDLEKKLTESEHNSHALQSAYSAAQAELFELRSRLDEEQSGKNSEMELVLGDLEVANQKLAAADKEISDLHSQLSELKTMAASHEGHLSSGSNDNEAIEEAFQRYANTSLEAELVAKERQIEQLVDENRRLSGSVASGKQSLELQRHRHQQDYSALEQQLEAMKEKLHQQRDYAEIKRELNIMKSVEFGFASTGEETTGQDSNTSSSATPDLISGSVVSKQSLELLLLEKNKKLQNEATNLRNSNASLQERLSVVEVELKMANRTTEEQSMLINQLEKDLSSVNQQFSKFRTEGDGAPNPPPPFSIEGSSDSDFTTEQKLLAAAVQEKVEESEPENTLLSIVSSQRERFKARNQELEVENKGYQQKISVLRGECDKLRTDNVQLYEKIKYLHSYNQSRSESGGGKNDVENRYSAEYENKLDPFTTFSQRERQRKYANLAGFEKVVLNVGQLIFSNRKARIMAFVYAMLLHALVFIVLWRFSLGATDISTFSQECQVKFASHMKEFHGHNDVMEAAGHLHELEGGGAAMEHAHVHAR